jgi:hypothetical protein
MSHFNGTKSGPPKKQKKTSPFHPKIYLNCSRAPLIWLNLALKEKKQKKNDEFIERFDVA